MTTTPGQLAAQMLERNTPPADRIQEEIEEYMKTLTALEANGSFELASQNPTLLNPCVVGILRERYARADGTGWNVAFHDPNLLEFSPQEPRGTKD